ncbi:MAG: ATP-dependent RNA helicase RhlE, partial [Halothiobacillaceae bacterium]
VINFDLPMVAEDYIHRIGRTGRAGASGHATSLVAPDDWLKLVRIERLTGHRLERQTIVGLEPARPEPRGNGAPRPNNGARRPHTAKPQPRQERYSRGETHGNVEVKFKASNAHGRRPIERSGNLG